MKIAQAIFLFMIIWVSQVLTSAEKPVSVEEHSVLQSELTQFIESYVKENLPNSEDFKMHSMYTRPPRKGVIQAHFNYSFESNGGRTQLLGHATLRNIKNETSKEWSLEKIEIEGEEITFEDPIVITPESANTPE